MMEHEPNPSDSIIVDHDIPIGKPATRGTWMPVYLILKPIAGGHDFDRIVESYPNLTYADVAAALLYAADIFEKPSAKR